MSLSTRRKLSRGDYTVGWLCALPLSERVAALDSLDEEHQAVPGSAYDENTYHFGSINGHNVVIACLPPGQPGPVEAARLVEPLSQSFPNMTIHLFVGIGGGIPRTPTPQDPTKDIRLGDVVIGWAEEKGAPGIIHHDNVRFLPGGEIELLGTLDKPHRKLLSAFGTLLTNHKRNTTIFEKHLEYITRNNRFCRPDLPDHLYNPNYDHVGESDCADCGPNHLIERVERKDKKFIFHQGTILSGSSVMKDPERRDALRRRFHNAICFEMEAAGVMDQTRCLVIRGVADYADSHKNGQWQEYAAATAASFAREFLHTIQPADIRTIEPATAKDIRSTSQTLLI